jgi:hypothetical protein
MIALARSSVVKCYCLCHQAERSVHRALLSCWEGFRTYYHPERKAALQGLQQDLAKLIPPNRLCPTREEMVCQVPRPGFLQVLLGRWLGKRKKEWLFSVSELSFVEKTIGCFLEILQSLDKPSPETLIDCRKDLWACTYLLDCRCHGLSELRLTRMVEHFEQTPWLPHKSVEELTGGDLALRYEFFRKAS